MKKDATKNRLQQYIRDIFQEYFDMYSLPMEANNDLVELRNNLCQTIVALLAELDTKSRFGIDIDYLYSDIERVNLTDAECPYWLNGSILEARPPGPTNDEIESLIRNIQKLLCEQKGIPFMVSEKLSTQIIDDVKRTFTLPNTNLPFTDRLYDRTRHFPWDLKQNTPCDICSENRAVDACHIIPASYGGSNNLCNILYLCPTYHRLFDRFMLMESEWQMLDFSGKSKVSANFAYHVLLPQMQEFWNRIDDGRYEKRGTYDHDINEDKILGIKEELIDEIKDLIRVNPGILLKQIELTAAADSKMVRKSISLLKKRHIVIERRKEGERCFFVVK